MERSKSTNVTLGRAGSLASEAAARDPRQRSLASWSATDRSTRRSCPIAAKPRCKVKPESVIHSDKWRGYNGLVDVGYGHFRVDHSKDQFVQGRSHINGIESFWSFAKRRLAKFNGIATEVFYLHLKETEFRFNYRKQNLYQTLLKMIRDKPL